MKQIGAVDFAR